MGSGDSFVHLHVHTEFSALDGKTTMGELFSTVSAFDMPAVSVNDHGNTSGMIEAAIQAEKYGVKFIPGIEAYHVNDSLDVRKDRVTGKAYYHMTMHAKDWRGYTNLLKLNSMGFEQERIYSDKSMIDNQMLEQHSEGLIATSGCLGSMVNQALLRNDWAEAKRLAGEQMDIFGRENYFIEIMDHGSKEDKLVIPLHVKLAKEMGLKLLATNDTHYTKPDEAFAHEAMLAINSGSTLNEPTYDNGGSRYAFSGSGYHIRSSREMRELFPNQDFPGACDNTLLVAEMSDVKIPHTGQPFHLPHYPLEGTGAETEEELLRKSTFSGLKERIGDEDGVVPQVYIDRANEELGIITDMGFPGYFLVVADLLNYVKKRGVPVGKGRGSGAGSLVNFANRITDIDPILWGLPFSRFLNKGRTDSPPDIDTDIPGYGQKILFDYAYERFGHDHVARIANYTRSKMKGAIKDSARVLGYPANLAMELNRSANSGQGSSLTLKDLIFTKRKDIKDEDKRYWDEAIPIRDMYKNDKDAKKIYDLAMGIEMRVRSYGTHAGGLVISPDTMWNYSSTRMKKGDSIPFAQFDKSDVERAGLVKFDFLGLDNLNQVDTAVKIINRDLGENLDIDKIPLDDKATFRLIQSGDLDGIFQINGESIREFIVALKPDRVEDIFAAVALFRPGPMSSNSHMEYAKRKNGLSAIKTDHPKLSDMLSDTMGLIVYQEQVMKIAQEFAGFSEQKADDFRSAMGKKKLDKMATMKVDFFGGFKKNGFTESLAQKLWDTIEPFAGYAFNKSHAVAYGMLTYETAYLKANYPAQFAAALIETSSDDKVVANVEWARRNGMQVFSPSINQSNSGPATNRDTIWLGLSNVKSVNANIIDGILHERSREDGFKTVENFVGSLSRYGLTKKMLENLAKCGAFDTLNVPRKQVVERSAEIIGAGKKVASIDEDEIDLFGGIIDEVETILDTLDLTGEEWSETEKLENEFEVMGFFGSKHPYSLYEHVFIEGISTGDIPKSAQSAEDAELHEGERVAIYGILMSYSKKNTSNGNVMEKFSVEGTTGAPINVIMFSKSRRVFDESKGKPILVIGKVESDDFGDDPVLQIRGSEYTALDVSGSSKPGGLRVVGSRRARERRNREIEKESEKAEESKRGRKEESSRAGSMGSSSASDRFRRRTGGSVVELNSKTDEESSTSRRRRRNPSQEESASVSSIAVETPKSLDTYMFEAGSPDILESLANYLTTRYSTDDSDGDVIVIRYGGEDIPLPIRFRNLSISDISDIEIDTGASLVN